MGHISGGGMEKFFFLGGDKGCFEDKGILGAKKLKLYYEDN